MQRHSRFLFAISSIVLALFLATNIGCLPSPTKPMGRADDKSDSDAEASDEKIVDRIVEKVDVPVFEAPGATADTGLSDPLPATPNDIGDGFAGLPTAPPSLGENRLSLSNTPSDNTGYEDQPLPDALPETNPLQTAPLQVAPLQVAPLQVEPTPVASLDALPVMPLATPAPVEPIAETQPSGDSALPELPAMVSPLSDPPSPSPLPTNPIASDPVSSEPDATALASPALAPVEPLKPVEPLAVQPLEPIAPITTEPQTTTTPEVPVVNVGDGSPAAPNRRLAGPLPLIPRDAFFGRPARSQAKISPDGKRVAFVSNRQGVPNVFVAPIDSLESAQPVTDDTKSGVTEYFWAFTSRHVVYLRDGNRPGSSHVYSVNLDTNETKNLTPIENVAAYVASASHRFPAEILVAINDRPPFRLHDIYRVNIVTGESRLVEKNTGFTGYEIDDDYRLRIAHRFTTEGGRMFATRENPNAPWKDFLEANPDDAVNMGVVGFDRTGEKVYFVDSREQDLSVLKVIDLAKNLEKRLAEHAQADVSGALLHPTEKNVQAVTFTYDRQKWKVLDNNINADLEYLHGVADGDLEITSRTLDDTMWTVMFRSDDAPDQTYLYRRQPRSTKLLFNGRPELVDLPLAKMHPKSISTRDGLKMVSYLTLPPGSDTATEGRPDRPLPMVLLVHGGPWARDVWGYNGLHQLLANRGYAVLSVNFRGSMGFGKSFTNAGNREWAGKMHADLVDGVRWAVNQRIALEDKVAIMGGSYGGYASLVGMTFTPELFACGIDIVGPANLVTLLENPLPTWSAIAPVLPNRIGDLRTPDGREFLLSRSPSRFVNRIQRPLLIAHGAEDASVTRAETDEIVQAMRTKGIPVTQMLFPDEGHGFQRDENRFAFYAIAEAFLAQHLGGRAQPIGSAVDRSSAQFPAGRDQIRDSLASGDANVEPAGAVLGQGQPPLEDGQGPAARTATLELPELQPLPLLE